MKGVVVIMVTKYPLWSFLILFFCYSFSPKSKNDVMLSCKRKGHTLNLLVKNTSDSEKQLTLYLFDTKYHSKKTHLLNINIDSLTLDGKKIDRFNISHYDTAGSKMSHISKDSGVKYISRVRTLKKISIKPNESKRIQLVLKGKKRKIRRIKEISFYVEIDKVTTKRRVEVCREAGSVEQNGTPQINGQ